MAGEQEGKARRVNRVKVRIGGAEYRLRGEEPASYLEALAAKVDERMAEVAGADSGLSQTQVAVLTALRTMDELVRLQEQHQRVLALMERQWAERREGGQSASPRRRSDV